MKPRTRPCAIPWAAGDGQYQSGSHGVVFGPPVSDVRTDTAGPDAHSRCSDGWNPALPERGKPETRLFTVFTSPLAVPVVMAFTLPEGGRGTFKPAHHQEAHGFSILGKQP